MASTIFDFSEDYASSARKEKTLFAVAGILLVLTWISVSLRVYVRKVMINSFGWDDWLILAALVFFTIQASFVILMVWTKIYVGLTALPVLTRVLEYTVVEMASYAWTSISLKLSLAGFFLRIVIEKWQRRVIQITVSIYSVYIACTMLVALFQCGNPADIVLNHLENKCIPWRILGPMNYVAGSFTAFTDWLFAILPIFVLRNVQMSWQAKLSVCFILALGAVGSIVSLIRIAYIDGLNFLGDVSFGQIYHILLVSMVELGLGIIAISLATLRPLFRHMLGLTRVGRAWTLRSKNRATACTELAPVSAVGTTVADQSQQDLEKCGTTVTFRTTPANSVSVPPDAEEPWEAMSLEEHDGKETVQALPPPEESSEEPAKRPSHSLRLPSFLGTRRDNEKEAWSDLEVARKHRRKDFTELENARKDWADRRFDYEGAERMKPNLLLPDFDEDEDEGLEQRVKEGLPVER